MIDHKLRPRQHKTFRAVLSGLERPNLLLDQKKPTLRNSRTTFHLCRPLRPRAFTVTHIYSDVSCWLVPLKGLSLMTHWNEAMSQLDILKPNLWECNLSRFFEHQYSSRAPDCVPVSTKR
ncbi:uncharacterized protein PV06_09848 [Exophiala oligosperma]|uniref:Uncharacterized protein n=1 Tax=Exophiala oligosperma TaxID=215243 RepID=A0A0D2DPV4_9EURO|nr:uncharacterized protein PV06_09848 [Exophiala oligosperma]KIW37864.1 hypothetical protein PV06_09848 [Exophiala oligosperma]